MKWYAVKDKPGIYEIRRHDGQIYGGIVIDGQNRGAAFAGSIEDNRYIFVFEDGMFSKSVKIYAGTKDDQIGTIKLGFIDTGTLESNAGTYEWKTAGSSKIWSDAEKNVVLFLDLENNCEKPVAVLAAENLAAQCKELLILSSWYLTVIEYRAGFTNCILAGMPVKTEESRKASKQEIDYLDWWEIIIDIALD